MPAFRLTHRLLVFLILMLAMNAFSSAMAQAIYSEYDEGTLGFHYRQWPFGGIEGDVLSDGPMWFEDLSFPEGQSSGTGGGIAGAVGDTTRALAVGLVANSDGTMDATLLYVTFPEGPAVGNYAIDTETLMAAFIYIQQASDLTIPEPGDDYQLWFDNLEAVHKFGSSSGTIHVTEVSEDGFAGTFDGLMGAPETFTIITITDGVFDVSKDLMSGVPMALAPASLAAAPNPFNPQTTVKLALDRAGAVDVTVYDLAGHRVTSLHRGLLDEGTHQWVWNGMNDTGIKQSGGVYFCRAEGRGWQTATKLVLVP